MYNHVIEFLNEIKIYELSNETSQCNEMQEANFLKCH